MKRIFTIFLCVLLLCSTFVIVGAEETDAHYLHGMWEFEDIIYPTDHDITWNVVFTERTPDADGNLRFGDTFDMLEVWYIPDGSGWFIYAVTKDYTHSQTLYSSNGSTQFNTKLFYFDGVFVSEDFYQWLSSNASEVFCDGSTCPVGDVDEDGVCEDCYRAMRMVAPDEGSPVYPSDLPALPAEVDNGNYEHFAFNSDGDVKLYSYHTQSYFVIGNSNNDLVTLEATSSSATGMAYKLVNGEWVYSGILSGDYTPCNRTDLIYSSTIIYDENGEYFFPLTLWAQILKTEQGAMKVEIPKLTNSMVSLVLCGVGCLALLIALPLLKKVFYKFL